MLLWAVERITDGVRLSRWSEVRAELAAVLDAGGSGNADGSRARDFPVVALRDSPLWEIRAGTPVPPADSSQQRRWLDQEDPAIGLSEPAFDLLRVGRNRERFLSVLRSFVDKSTKSSNPEISFWEIEPGVVQIRRAIHKRYGGNHQSGISPCAENPNILLFTNPIKGRIHGYFDGWGDDGCFHYTGEGQGGDQKMAGNNLAVLNHRTKDRALRLFHVMGSGVQYVGEFELDADFPWYTSRAPGTRGGPMRSVIMFRLRPQGSVHLVDATIPASTATTSRVVSVPIEESSVDQYAMIGPEKPITAVRREANLVRDYAAYLRSLGHDVCRKQILPLNELGPLFTDLYDETSGELVEAKGAVTREAIRMGIGQLLDYRRFIEPAPRLILLVPSEPRPDLLNLCASVDVNVVWKTDSHPVWASSQESPRVRGSKNLN
ncbi:hypothetical protein [Frankia gtarii]|uniref:hypothetical protein n=1 Tax=Frankia gtarii TaxID=2950102 RepID=UPI0021BF53B8|nr:hypothetical protein [Frankia gtarii]